MDALERSFSVSGSELVSWGTKKTEYGTLYAFEDPLNKGDKEQSLLRKVESNMISVDELEQKHKLAGVFCLISDMTKEGFDMFGPYKGQEDVEMALLLVPHVCFFCCVFCHCSKLHCGQPSSHGRLHLLMILM